MPDGNVRVQGPVSIQSESKYRVALELAVRIADHEDDVNFKGKNREYWLKLYWQSLRTVSGNEPSTTLK